MSQTGRKTPFDVDVTVRSRGQKPSDAQNRIDRCVEQVMSLVVSKLFPLLRELSDGVDDNEPMRHYPCIAPIVSGCWRAYVVVYVQLAHVYTNEEVLERFAEWFGPRLYAIAERTLILPQTESWPAPGGCHYKQRVGFMPSYFWDGATT